MTRVKEGGVAIKKIQQENTPNIIIIQNTPILLKIMDKIKVISKKCQF